MSDISIRKPIPGYEGYYSCDMDGNIYSDPRTIIGKSRWGGEMKSSLKGYKLKLARSSRGYYHVNLYMNGRKHILLVQRIVALIFIGPRPEGYHIMHINNIRTDNRVSNLRYATRREIINNNQLNGRIVCGEGLRGSKLTEFQVIELRKIPYYKGLFSDQAKKLGVTASNVSYAYRGVSWKYLPNAHPYQKGTTSDQ